MKLNALFTSILVIAGIVLGLIIAGAPINITLPIIGGIIIFFAAFCYPVIVIAVLLGVVPFNFVWAYGGMTIFKIIYTAVYLFLVSSWLIRRKESLASPISLPLAALFCAFAVACITGILHGHKTAHWGSDLNAISYYGLCFMMIDMVKDKKTLYRLFILSVITIVLGLLKSVAYLELGPSADTVGIARGGVVEVRTPAIIGLFMFMVSVAMSVGLPSGRQKIIFMVLSVFFGVMQLLSFFRSLWIGAIFGLMFLFFASGDKGRRNFLKLVIGGIFLFSLYVCAALSASSDNILFKSLRAVEQRFVSIFTTAKHEPTIITRNSEARAALKKALEHPIIGNGLGTEITYFRYDEWFGINIWETTRYIHNVYLFLFLNTGPPGLLLFIFFYASLVRYGLVVYRGLQTGKDKAFVLGATSGFISLLVASLAGPFLTSPSLTMWLGFFMGSLMILDRLGKARGGTA